MGFKTNLSTDARERHYRTVINLFAREVSIVTEFRDGCVWKTKQVGKVAFFQDALPFNREAHVVT